MSFPQRRVIVLPNKSESVHPIVVSAIEYAIGAYVCDYNRVVGHLSDMLHSPLGFVQGESDVMMNGICEIILLIRQPKIDILTSALLPCGLRACAR